MGKRRKVGEGTADTDTHSLAACGYAAPARIEDVVAEPPGNLRPEIALVRMVLADLLAMPLAPDKRAAVVSSLTAALVRLLRENRALDGSHADHLDAAVAAYLRTDGLAARRAANPMEGGDDGPNTD